MEGSNSLDEDGRNFGEHLQVAGRDAVTDSLQDPAEARFEVDSLGERHEYLPDAAHRAIATQAPEDSRGWPLFPADRIPRRLGCVARKRAPVRVLVTDKRCHLQRETVVHLRDLQVPEDQILGARYLCTIFDRDERARAKLGDEAARSNLFPEPLDDRAREHGHGLWMLGDESIESALRQPEKLAVCYRGDIGRARLVREQRHLTHRFPGPNLADSRLGAIVAQREGAKPAGDHEVEAIARRALL